MQEVRPAVLVERFHITRCELGLDTCVIGSAQYISACGRSLDSARLRTALEKVLHVHPALGLQAYGEAAGKPAFVRLETVDLSQIVEVASDASSLQDVLENQFSTSFKIECPHALWRVSLLKDGTVVFAFYHAIADGQGVLGFHHSLLSALNSLPESLPDPPAVVSLPPLSPSDILPAVDDLTDISASFLKLCREIYGALAPEPLKPGGDAWTGNPVAPSPISTTHVRLWELSPAASAQLVALCRARGCTLTTYIHVLSTHTISHLLSTRGVPGKCKTLSVIVAVSLRRYTGTSVHALADQSSAVHFHPRIASVLPASPPSPGAYPAFPWAEAAATKEKLQKKLRAAREEIGPLRYLFGRYRAFFTGQLGKRRGATLVVSNIGRFEAALPQPQKELEQPVIEESASASKKEAAVAPSGEWKIASVFFGQQDSTCGQAFKISVVGSPDGGIGVMLTWGEGSVDDEMADAFVRIMKEWTADILARSLELAA